MPGDKKFDRRSSVFARDGDACVFVLVLRTGSWMGRICPLSYVTEDLGSEGKGGRHFWLFELWISGVISICFDMSASVAALSFSSKRVSSKDSKVINIVVKNHGLSLLPAVVLGSESRNTGCRLKQERKRKQCYLFQFHYKMSLFVPVLSFSVLILHKNHIQLSLVEFWIHELKKKPVDCIEQDLQWPVTLLLRAVWIIVISVGNRIHRIKLFLFRCMMNYVRHQAWRGLLLT